VGYMAGMDRSADGKNFALGLCCHSCKHAVYNCCALLYLLLMELMCLLRICSRQKLSNCKAWRSQVSVGRSGGSVG